MQLQAKIYIVGHTGLVGSAIRRRLETLGYGRLLLRTPNDLDLTRQHAVEDFFSWERPDYVFLAATGVGDAFADVSSPADVLYQNLAIEVNLITSAYQAGVKRLLFLGSSCIYPRLTPQHLQEMRLPSEQLESRDRAHAITKLAGVELCAAYNREHGCRYLSVMPSNLYGRGHSYDLHNSQLIPAMIFKIHQAKVTGERKVVLQEPGNQRRGFLYSDDLADACVSLMNLDEPAFDSLLSGSSGPLIGVGGEEDFTMRELAELVAEVVTYRGELLFDISEPDGNTQRLADPDKIETLRWRSQISFKERLRLAYKASYRKPRTWNGNLHTTVICWKVRAARRKHTTGDSGD
jgi:GDP-L-fucose synthase